MQNIVQLSKLREYLLPLDESLISEREGPLTFRLREFMANMWNGEGTYNPSSLHSTIVKAAPQFRGFRQQDSHELLRCLLDGVRMEEIDRIRAIGEIEKSKTPNTFIDDVDDPRNTLKLEELGQLLQQLSESDRRLLEQDEEADMNTTIPRLDRRAFFKVYDDHKYEAETNRLKQEYIDLGGAGVSPTSPF